MTSSKAYQTFSLNKFFTFFIVSSHVIFNLISDVNCDRGSFIGCYRSNIYLRRLEFLSGSIDVCVDGCEHLFYR